jgi:antitoxin (DNA-binding transcriptional repressor) of toxin-antitoxin stability system
MIVASHGIIIVAIITPKKNPRPRKSTYVNANAHMEAVTRSAIITRPDTTTELNRYLKTGKLPRASIKFCGVKCHGKNAPALKSACDIRLTEIAYRTGNAVTSAKRMSTAYVMIFEALPVTKFTGNAPSSQRT